MYFGLVFVFGMYFSIGGLVRWVGCIVFLLVFRLLFFGFLLLGYGGDYGFGVRKENEKWSWIFVVYFLDVEFFIIIFRYDILRLVGEEV